MDSLILCCSIVVVMVTVTTSLPVSPSSKMNMTQIIKYFTVGQYMGLKNPNPEIASITNPDNALRIATETWQRNWGFNVTGELTAEQVEIMSQPRCNVPDIMKTEDMKRRKKRYAAFSKWDHNDLTYKISVYPYDHDLSDPEVDDAIHRAFQVWAKVTPLTFTRLPRTSKVDIDIQFGSYSHGDYYPFDGPNGYLAHAFFPPMGDTHFDDSETWTLNTKDYNLYIVAVHEFGHALGLGHSTMVPSAIMYPNYRYQENLQLDYDDILGIQTLYGSPSNDPEWPKDRPDIEPTTKSTTTPTPTKTPKPDGQPTQKPQPTQPPRPTVKPTIPPFSPNLPKVCENPRIDAITYVEDLENPSDSGTFGFQGEYYFKIGDYGYVDDAYPRLIRDDWKGIPDNIDAALFWERTRKLPSMSLIFKGDEYWAVQGKKAMPGYPKPMSNLGIPSNIDAAFVWNYNGKTYFFKDFYFYRYTRGQGPDSGYPRRISTNWPGIPDDIDAAFKWDNMQTYFFKGNNYWRYNDGDGRISDDYPRNFENVWLKCSRVHDDRGIYGVDNGNKNNTKNVIGGTNDGNTLQITFIPVLFSVLFALVFHWKSLHDL